jgi:hypothetical protein
MQVGETRQKVCRRFLAPERHRGHRDQGSGETPSGARPVAHQGQQFFNSVADTATMATIATTAMLHATMVAPWYGESDWCPTAPLAIETRIRHDCASGSTRATTADVIDESSCVIERPRTDGGAQTWR